MLILKIPFVRTFLNWYFLKYPPEMVKYWKTSDKVRAKLLSTPDGYQMQMEGEKYLFPGYPRGHLLFTSFSKLKHEIKNQIFNDSWYLLEDGTNEEVIVGRLKGAILPKIFEIADSLFYEMVPPDKLSPPVKELWRAMGEVEKKLPPARAYRARRLKEILCFVLQEDDAYRFRFQWVAGWVNPKAWWRRILRRDFLQDLDWALSLLEHAELVGDMKERQRLLRRILIVVFRDKETRESLELLIKELDWKKLKLSKADKYFFRGKYFKVDYPYFEY